MSGSNGPGSSGGRPNLPKLKFKKQEGKGIKADSSISLPSPIVTCLLNIGDNQYPFDMDDLEEKQLLGAGAYGKVIQYKHKPSNSMVAVKRVRINMDNLLIGELAVLEEAMKRGKCEFIVCFYGSLKCEGEVLICMELMKYSMDKITENVYAIPSRIPEKQLMHISYSIVQGLHYVKTVLNVIHRDVKPSNMLIGLHGEVKICDFGISGKLIDSIAKTHDVGCRPYMAPERLQPDEDSSGYGILSDVWSFGISLYEMSTGTFPYGHFKNAFEQVTRVVEGDAPKLPEDFPYSDCCKDIVHSCLRKNQYERPNYVQLLKDKFLKDYKLANDDMAAWIKTLTL
ncbi:hypothetical protein LOD99_13014 [Oopsacas minuta]|uniref:mitogen-activated protein kinase kinase n=1 Tax=Oopsacas minuta TaxID=111878 RepID=A0AAV7JAL6_9METZ|nr:hypothetical protein LOD99_13014 [Oopsacas minuta]